MESPELDKERYFLAKEVIHWHTFSDKTSDTKPADISIEEAEAIVFRFELTQS